MKPTGPRKATPTEGRCGSARSSVSSAGIPTSTKGGSPPLRRDSRAPRSAPKPVKPSARSACRVSSWPRTPAHGAYSRTSAWAPACSTRRLTTRSPRLDWRLCSGICRCFVCTTTRRLRRRRMRWRGCHSVARFPPRSAATPPRSSRGSTPRCAVTFGPLFRPPGLARRPGRRCWTVKRPRVARLRCCRWA